MFLWSKIHISRPIFVSSNADLVMCHRSTTVTCVYQIAVYHFLNGGIGVQTVDRLKCAVIYFAVFYLPLIWSWARHMAVFLFVTKFVISIVFFWFWSRWSCFWGNFDTHWQGDKKARNVSLIMFPNIRRVLTFIWSCNCPMSTWWTSLINSHMKFEQYPIVWQF